MRGACNGAPAVGRMGVQDSRLEDRRRRKAACSAESALSTISAVFSADKGDGLEGEAGTIDTPERPGTCVACCILIPLLSRKLRIQASVCSFFRCIPSRMQELCTKPAANLIHRGRSFGFARCFQHHLVDGVHRAALDLLPVCARESVSYHVVSRERSNHRAQLAHQMAL